MNEIGSKGRVQVRNLSLHNFDGEVIAAGAIPAVSPRTVWGRGGAVSGHEYLSMLSGDAVRALPAV